MIEKGPISDRIGFDMRGLREGGSPNPSQYDLAFEELVRAGSDPYEVIRKRHPEVFYRPIGAEFDLTPRQQSRLSMTSLSYLNLPTGLARTVKVKGFYGGMEEEAIETLADLLRLRTWNNVFNRNQIGVKRLYTLRVELKKFIDDEDYKKAIPRLTPAEESASTILEALAVEDPLGQVSIVEFAERLDRSPAWANVVYNNLKKKKYPVPLTRRKR